MAVSVDRDHGEGSRAVKESLVYAQVLAVGTTRITVRLVVGIALRICNAVGLKAGGKGWSANAAAWCCVIIVVSHTY